MKINHGYRYVICSKYLLLLLWIYKKYNFENSNVQNKHYIHIMLVLNRPSRGGADF